MLQVFMAGDLSKTAEDQYHARLTIEPKRGTIYDRHGVPLTTDLGDYVTLGANPKRVLKPVDLAKDISRLTGKPANYYLQRLKRDGDYVVLARKVPPATADKLELRGWQLIRQEETRRTYPHNQLASQLLGFTDIDNKGISGVELACEPLLRGEQGWRVVQLDVRGHVHLDGSLPYKAPVDGLDVALTIDLDIQSIVEEALAPALTLDKAESASALVLDPRTGEILALCSLPEYNPNSPDQAPAERQKIRPVVDLFEPGSTFKIIGASYLLEKGLARPSTKVDCSDGYVKIYNKVITDSKKHGILNMEDVVAYSSNVGMIKLTWNVPPDALYNQVKDFGFLSKSGVEVEGEATGLLPKVKNWSGLTKPNLVIGQGIAVSMVQLAMAYATIANDGVLMRPTLIKGRYTSDGSLIETTPTTVRQVVSKQTARTITSFLTKVVDEGTATRASIEGMTIAGKTGTAQKINTEHGGYYKDRFVSSFVGFFPADDPRFLVMVLLDDPKGDLHQGGQVAAPIFKGIAERIIGLNPDLWARNNKGKAVKPTDIVAVPDLRYRSADQAGATLEKLGFEIRTHGDGPVICDQMPPPGTKAHKGDAVELTLGPEPRRGGGQIVVPILTGLSLREAISKASHLGLTIQFTGTGRVVKQLPASGERASVGDVLTLLASS
jgi:stage V sporulation protein D (sporulation-specific penicillin-binding protein)